MQLNHFISSKHLHNIRCFRLIVIAFFFALIIPTALIVYYGFMQFKNEMYFQYRWKASNAVVQINKVLSQRFKTEQERTIKDYNFYQYVENPVDRSWQKVLSPLANPGDYPMGIGFIGYFKIDKIGELSTPLLHYATRKEIAAANTELDWDEIEKRLAQQISLENIL